MSQSLLMALLRISSPTYKEKEKCDFLESWLARELPTFRVTRFGNNLIAKNNRESGPHIGFVGHIDTVPEFFDPYEESGKLFGSGASDMQAGLASMLTLIKENEMALSRKYRLSIIIYDKEEGTPLHENGLNELIVADPESIDAMDVAIVGEPTNNAIQLGCVGSIHYTLTVHGKAAHSARPWQGENALYKALPIMDAFSKLERKKQTIFGVDFFDVMTITESQSSRGRTTVPETWQANINYRFSPVHSLTEAKTHVPQVLDGIGVDYKLSCLNAVDAGAVIEHPLLESLKTSFKFEAKQAWTDVAQLTSRGICAFNFGPGRQDQAHHPNEYVVIADMVQYEQLLKNMLLEAS